jgi:hypothetical protein
LSPRWREPARAGRSIAGDRLDLVDYTRLERPDAFLVALVEGPLFDALGPHSADLDQEFHVLGYGRLTYPQLLCDQEAANPVLYEIAVDLRAEMRGGVFEPTEDLQPRFA